MPVITRKIEIYINAPVKEEKKAYTDKLFSILRLVHKHSNLCASHLYFADNISQFLYLTEETRNKLADASKNEEGILATSYQNMLYELSKSLTDQERKGLTKILADTGNRIYKSYNTGAKGQKERDKVRRGEISVKNYKEDVPIPFSKQQFVLFPDDGNYVFDFYHIPFRTKCGKDLSGNRIIIDRVINSEYGLCDSAIQYSRRKNKWFLLLTVSLPNEAYDPVKGKKAFAELGIETPIVLSIGKNKYQIGTSEEFLHRRLQIQGALRRLQTELQYNTTGGHGRKQKLDAIDRFHLKEKQYVQQKMHVYSKLLVNICRKNKIESIVLVNFEAMKKFSKEESEKFLLRNWSYYGLIEKIKYKSSLIGINIETE